MLTYTSTWWFPLKYMYVRCIAAALFPQALDRHQSWSWIIEHRLPLFLKSDILSEYKLCKLLSQRGPKSPPTRSHSSIRLQTSPSRKHCSDEKQSDTSLPSIIQTSTSSILIKAASTTALKSSPITRGVSTSFSDIELTPKRHTGAILARKRSQSMDLSSLPMVHDQSTRLSSDEAKLIGSKSGMKMFWKFLRGKAGEKNWLFWLDAERVGYHTNPTYQQRYTCLVQNLLSVFGLFSTLVQVASGVAWTLPSPQWSTSSSSWGQE